jgi:alanine-synthesizing transaminase
MDFGMLLLEQGNVAVSPGSGFGPAGEGYLRMSLVENEARLRQAVRQIKQCLRDAESNFAPSSASPQPSVNPVPT